MFFKKKKEQNDGSEETKKPSMKKRIFKTMYTPIGYDSNKDFAKSVFAPKEGNIIKKKAVEWYQEVKYRLTTKPYEMETYEDWQRYMGVEDCDPDLIKSAIKKYFIPPAVIMAAMLFGAVMFCDSVVLNSFIYLVSAVFFPFVFFSYRYWNWIVDNKKYVSFKDWMFKKRT